MKKTFLFLTLALIVTLCGCAVNELPAAECVSDSLTFSEAPAYMILAELPQELVLSGAANDGKYAVFDCADYTLTEEIFNAASLDDAFLRLTGREKDTLLPIRIPSFPHERYEFAWTAAEDGGEVVCCGTLLYDGQDYYAVTVRCPAEHMPRYRETFSALLSAVELVPV